MGFPASLLPWKADRLQGSQAAAGRKYDWLLHPIVWVRWRVAVRRQGAYAPDFDEFRRKGTQ